MWTRKSAGRTIEVIQNRLDFNRCCGQTFPFCRATPAGWSGTLRRQCWLDNDGLCCCASCWTAAETVTRNVLRRGRIPSANTVTHKETQGRKNISQPKIHHQNVPDLAQPHTCWLQQICMLGRLESLYMVKPLV